MTARILTLSETAAMLLMEISTQRMQFLRRRRTKGCHPQENSKRESHVMSSDMFATLRQGSLKFALPSDQNEADGSVMQWKRVLDYMRTWHEKAKADG